MRGSRDNWRVGGVHHQKMAAVGLACEAGDRKCVECILRGGHVSPAFCCIPIAEVSMVRVECIAKEYNAQSPGHFS